VLTLRILLNSSCTCRKVLRIANCKATARTFSVS
jgi:hypothetical protein